MSQYLDKDVQVKAYLLQIYECPAEQRKCNDDLADQVEEGKEEGAQGPEGGQGDGRAPSQGRRSRRR